MMRRWAMIVLGIGLLAATGWARPGVVVTRQGQRYEGDVRNDGGYLVIETTGITVRVEQSQVVDVQFYGSPAQEFQTRMSSLPPGDVKARLDLARWAFGRRMYSEARLAAESVFDINPNSSEAADYIQLIDRHRRLERESATAATSPAAVAPVVIAPAATEPAEPPPATGESPTTRPDRVKLLSAAEVNHIRQLYWKRSDETVRVRLPDDVRRQFARDQGYNPAQFVTQPILTQAYEILQHGKPAQVERVTILNDPIPVATYRRQIQPRLLAGCASAGCHGANPAGDFALVSPADRDSVAFTNLNTLLTAVVADEEGEEWRMLDLARPERSLLLQYGLPRGTAERPHPLVRGFRAVFLSERDSAYNTTLDWIARMLATGDSEPPPETPAYVPVIPLAPEPPPMRNNPAGSRRNAPAGGLDVRNRMTPTGR